MIEVVDLTKHYRKVIAIDKISFKVQKGDVLGFLGPNGAGKTTTMRILTGAIPATSGSARLAEFDVFEQPLEVKKRIGYLPESPPLYDELDVDSYLDFTASIKGLSKKRRKAEIERVVDTCNLSDVYHRRIGNLSKGYRQRLGLAQALLGDPEILILDEPTIGLDPNQIVDIRSLIRQLAENHTVILSTHNLGEVIQICNKLTIIHRGQVVANDSLENLTSDGTPLEQIFHNLTQN
jgi:ABC-2 type transport system ATP-binding protein